MFCLGDVAASGLAVFSKARGLGGFSACLQVGSKESESRVPSRVPVEAPSLSRASGCACQVRRPAIYRRTSRLSVLLAKASRAENAPFPDYARFHAEARKAERRFAAGSVKLDEST